METIIGTKNVGFEIIKAEYLSEKKGYCIGKSEDEYVTWFFMVRENEPFYNYGHYIQIDHDAPCRSAAKAYADYHERLVDAYNDIVTYGI